MTALTDFLGSLEVGESFLLDDPKDIWNARNALTYVRRQTGLILVRRSYPAGLRIWCAGEVEGGARRTKRTDGLYETTTAFPIPTERERRTRVPLFAPAPDTPPIKDRNSPVYGMLHKLKIGEYLFFASALAPRARSYASMIAKIEGRKFLTARAFEGAIRVERTK